MPSTSSGGLTIPLDSDPLADVGLAIRDLADDIDARTPNKMRRGVASATPDASGDITVTHGLGVTPTVVLATSYHAAGPLVLAVHTITSTDFKIRHRVSNTTTAYTSATSDGWLAIA